MFLTLVRVISQFIQSEPRLGCKGKGKGKGMFFFEEKKAPISKTEIERL